MADGQASRRAPPDLVARGRGRKFWREVVAEFELGPDDVELLAETCRQLDLVDLLREAIGTDVLVSTGEGGRKVHPAMIELRQVRIELRRSIAALGLPAPDDAGAVELPPEVPNILAARGRRAARGRWES